MLCRIKKVVFPVAIMLCTLTGCRRVESAEKLYAYANDKFGSCSLLEKISHGRKGHDAYTEIKCRDDEYGFTYTVKSYMKEQNLDGASLGYHPLTVSDFETNYAGYIYETNKDSIDAVCEKYGTGYELWEDWVTENYGHGNGPYASIYCFGVVKANDSDSAGKAAAGIGEIYSDADTRLYFITGREDGSAPPVIKGKPFEAADREESLGELSVIDLEWHSIEDKRIDSALEKAATYDDTAEYVGQHTGVFADTGASLGDVMKYGNDYPKEMDSPVIFYDFITEDGTEFWITDFSVKPPYGEHKGACTNFPE
ncbi:MAG: hypothetical protein K6F34_10680 [Lachnospiraceae bacterium]|nr:hypothetical protein [Lachnospiraceae bacterium]